jgi:LysM repeat protein
VEHPFVWSLTSNRRSWNDAEWNEHLYEQDDAGEVEMAAVPSTIGCPADRKSIGSTERLRVVRDPVVAGEQIPDVGRYARARKAAARRRLGTLCAVVGLVGLWFGTGALGGSQNVAPNTALSVAPGTVYVVRAGDTLQSIAENLVPRRDVLALVHSLAREVHGDSLRPGTVLRIP